MPNELDRVLHHELGHFITMAHRPEGFGELLSEVEALRDDQGV